MSKLPHSYSYSSFVWIILILSCFTCPQLEGRSTKQRLTSLSPPSLPLSGTSKTSEDLYQQFSASHPASHHDSLESHGTNLGSSSQDPVNPHANLGIETSPWGEQLEPTERTGSSLPGAIRRRPILATSFTQQKHGQEPTTLLSQSPTQNASPQMMQPRKLDFDPILYEANDMHGSPFESGQTSLTSPSRLHKNPLFYLWDRLVEPTSSTTEKEMTTTTRSEISGDEDLDEEGAKEMEESLSMLTLGKKNDNKSRTNVLSIKMGPKKEDWGDKGLEFSHDEDEGKYRQDMIGQGENNGTHLNVSSLVTNTNMNDIHFTHRPTPSTTHNDIQHPLQIPSPSLSLPPQQQDNYPGANQTLKEISSSSPPSSPTGIVLNMDYSNSSQLELNKEGETGTIMESENEQEEDTTPSNTFSPFDLVTIEPSSSPSSHYTLVYIDENRPRPLFGIPHFFGLLLDWLFSLFDDHHDLIETSSPIDKNESDLEEDDDDTEIRGTLGPGPTAGVIGAGILICAYVYYRTWRYVKPGKYSFTTVPSFLTDLTTTPGSVMRRQNNYDVWPYSYSQDSFHASPNLDFDDDNNFMYLNHLSYDEDHFDIPGDSFGQRVNPGGNLAWPLSYFFGKR